MSLVFRRLLFIVSSNCIETVLLVFLYLSVGLWISFSIQLNVLDSTLVNEVNKLIESIKYANGFFVFFISIWGLLYLIKSFVAIIFLTKYTKRFKIAIDRKKIIVGLYLSFLTPFFFLPIALYNLIIYLLVYSWNRKSKRENITYINGYEKNISA